MVICFSLIAICLIIRVVVGVYTKTWSIVYPQICIIPFLAMLVLAIMWGGTTGINEAQRQGVYETGCYYLSDRAIVTQVTQSQYEIMYTMQIAAFAGLILMCIITLIQYLTDKRKRKEEFLQADTK